MELVIGDVIDHLNRLMFVNRLEKEGPVAGCGEEQRAATLEDMIEVAKKLENLQRSEEERSHQS